MPYKDPEKRRAYQREYQRRLREKGLAYGQAQRDRRCALRRISRPSRAREPIYPSLAEVDALEPVRCWWRMLTTRPCRKPPTMRAPGSATRYCRDHAPPGSIPLPSSLVGDD